MTGISLKKTSSTVKPYITALVLVFSSLSYSLVSSAAIPEDWPQDSSDLAADPNIQYGQLENGLRFAIMPNQTPANQASMRFLFDVGSKQEYDDERGMAHFLEHMAFNGSKNIPEGEMVKILERLGLAFGADTNASTSYEQTIYKLDLPNTDVETVDTAFLLMREVASNLSLNPAALDRERGVVLAEKRASNLEQLRNAEAEYNFIIPSNRFFQRLPIGTEEGINTITAAQMRAFYQQFYRPEKAFLVIVGDFEAAYIEEKIQSVFADWQSIGNPRDLSFLEDTEKSENIELGVKHWQSPNATAQVNITYVAPFEENDDSIAKRNESALRSIASSIFGRRMNELLQKGEASFIASSARIAPSYDRQVELASFNLVVDENNWEQGFAQGYTELKRALSYGFSATELELSLSSQLSFLEDVEKAAQQRPSQRLASSITSLFARNRVATSPSTNLKIFKDFAETVSPEEIIENYRPSWNASPAKIFFLTKEDVDDADARLLAGYTTVREIAVDPIEEVQQSSFAYTNFGAPGKVKESYNIELTDSISIRFENNLMLNLKQTDFQESRVIMSARFGGGLISVPKANAALLTFIPQAFSGGGTKAHSAVDLPKVLEGKQVSANLSVGEGAFQFVSQVSNNDLLLQLQLWLGYMTEPAYREGPVDLFKRQVSAVYANLNAVAPQVAQIQVPNLIHNKDPRFGLPPKEQLMAVTAASVGEFLRDQLENSALEITIVGDINIEDTIAAVAQTFGTLPVREAQPRAYTAEREVSFPEPGLEILNHNGDTQQAALQIYWPTVDYSDVTVSAKLDLLSALITDRIRQAVREDLGASYSPRVSNLEHNVFPNYGYFAVSLDAKTADVEKLSHVIRNEIKRAIADGFTADELERARQPLIARGTNGEKTNPYWLNRIAQSQSDPAQLSNMPIILETYANTSALEIQTLAAQFLTADTAFEVQVLPNIQ